MSLYQALLLDHYRNPASPRHAFPAYPCRSAHNPTCGDRLEMQLLIKDGIIENDVLRSGCAISQASASLHGIPHRKTPEETQRIGKDGLLALLGVDLSPNRLKCAAALAFETFTKALKSWHA